MLSDNSSSGQRGHIQNQEAQEPNVARLTAPQKNPFLFFVFWKERTFRFINQTDYQGEVIHSLNGQDALGSLQSQVPLSRADRVQLLILVLLCPCFQLMHLVLN